MHRQQINIYKTINDIYIHTYNNNILKVQNEIIIKQNEKKHRGSGSHTWIRHNSSPPNLKAEGTDDLL